MKAIIAFLTSLTAMGQLGGPPLATADDLDQYHGHRDLHDPDHATGWFSIGKDLDGQIWLWTPEGNAFFGAGVNKLSLHWLREFNKESWEDTYQADADIWRETQRTRLLDWGFNSVSFRSMGDSRDERYLWDDPYFYRQLQLPYAPVIYFVAHADVRHVIEKAGLDYEAERYPDVWSEEWIEEADVRAERMIGRVHDDPYVLGYYMAEEPDTHYRYKRPADRIWADYIIEQPGTRPGKKAWVEFMSDLYDTVADFNAVYGDQLSSDIKDFDELHTIDELRMRPVPDARDFTAEIMGQFAHVAHSKIRKYDKNHLIFSPRFNCAVGWIFRQMLDAVAPYTDALAFNPYGKSPHTWDIVHAYYEQPILIAETSYLGDDTGYQNSPFPRVADQTARGVNYRSLFSELAAKPYILGIWWHAYYDHGGDGGWRNWGLVDPLTDEPYYDFIDRVVPTNERLFGLHHRELSPHWWMADAQQGSAP